MSTQFHHIGSEQPDGALIHGEPHQVQGSPPPPPVACTQGFSYGHPMSTPGAVSVAACRVHVRSRVRAEAPADGSATVAISGQRAAGGSDDAIRRGRHPPMTARGSCCGARLGRCVVFQRWMMYRSVPATMPHSRRAVSAVTVCAGKRFGGVWRRASSWRDGAGDRNVPDGSDGAPRLAADTFDRRDLEVSAGRCGRRRRGDPVWL